MEKDNKNELKKTQHVPVLLHDVITTLALAPVDAVVDGTVGGGGYTKAILEHLGESGMLLGIDADQSALDRVRAHVVGNDTRVRFIVGNFRNIDLYVAQCGLTQVNKIVLDLGLSSDQLEQSGGRGFSFMFDEPLTMTFAHTPQKEALTAWHVVNEWSEESLADIIFGFGGDRMAKRIAGSICKAREEKSIETSKELAEIVEHVVPRRSGVHPATKTFQAIRIAVNDELGALEEVLAKSKTLLAPKGRIVIVTFHSLEDRIVKRAFVEWEKEGLGKRITKHPIVPSRQECVENRRSRSAKLRCFEKA
jgi:16S rRNA (cytosine1402-N4)-methyltransferase